MRFITQSLACLILLLMTQLVSAATSPKIEYTVSFIEPQAHYVEVEMRISNINQNELEIAMPVWAPGSFYIFRKLSN